MKRAVISERNASVTVPGARVVVAGGTQGIGAAVACRFAQAGAEVWIIGRNETKANAVLERLRGISRDVSQGKKVESAPEHRFLKADLSLVVEAKRVAQDIRARAGVRGVDYLIMCQGGLPSGSYVLTSEGIEQHYAVEVISRFVLAYKLVVESDPVVSKGVLSVMAPGRRRPALDYEDLDLRKANEKGSYGIVTCTGRDSMLVDFFTEELGRRAPQDIIFTHVYPGGVKTDIARNSSMPWYLSSISSAALALLGDTPDSYAQVPFYLLAHPEGRAATSRARLRDQHAEAIEANPVLQEAAVRTKMWNHLMRKLDVPQASSG